jgi:hypothetical protein
MLWATACSTRTGGGTAAERESMGTEGGTRPYYSAAAPTRRLTLAQRGAGELHLPDKAANAALAHQTGEGGAVARGREHQRGPLPAPARDPARHLESTDIWKLEIEQHDLWAERRDFAERADTIRGLAEHREAVFLEQLPSETPEAGVIIDDQQSDVHRNPSCPPARRTNVRITDAP